MYCAFLLLAHHVLGAEQHTLISGRSRSACSFHMTWESAYLPAHGPRLFRLRGCRREGESEGESGGEGPGMLKSASARAASVAATAWSRHR